jgi:hypothetical protein
MSTQGAVGRAVAPSSRRFLVLLGVLLLAFLGIVSWVAVSSDSPERQDISDYNQLSLEHLGAVDRAMSFTQLPGVSDQLRLRPFAWMACADNWLLDGSPEFGPGGLRVFPLPAAFEQQRLVQDLIALSGLETTLADSHMPEAERTSAMDTWSRLMEQTQADEANLRAALGLPPLRDQGVAYHVLARCGAY